MDYCNSAPTHNKKKKSYKHTTEKLTGNFQSPYLKDWQRKLNRTGTRTQDLGVTLPEIKLKFELATVQVGDFLSHDILHF